MPGSVTADNKHGVRFLERFGGIISGVEGVIPGEVAEGGSSAFKHRDTQQLGQLDQFRDIFRVPSGVLRDDNGLFAFYQQLGYAIEPVHLLGKRLIKDD